MWINFVFIENLFPSKQKEKEKKTQVMEKRKQVIPHRKNVCWFKDRRRNACL
jgi:hypothetical protein